MVKLHIKTTEFRQSVIGGMSSARKPLAIWWNSEHQKPLDVSLIVTCHWSLTGGF